MREMGATDHGPAPALLLDQPAGGEKSQMVGKRGRGHARALLYLSNRETVGSGTHEVDEHLESRLRSDRCKTVCRFFQGEHRTVAVCQFI